MMTSFGSPPGNVPFPVIPEPLVGLLPPFHQVAFYCHDAHHVEACVRLLVAMGFDEWHRDEPLYIGKLNGQPVSSRGNLAFNYQVLNGFELEFLSHEGVTPWNERHETSGPIFVSHMSSYVNSVAETRDKLAPIIGDPYYVRETHDHKNPHVVGVKRFREYIYQTHEIFGFDVKTIQRIPWGDG